MGYYIKAIEYYLPSKIIDNEFLEKECGIDKSFTENKVGIIERRIAQTNESTSEMATESLKILLANNNINPKDIELLILCTQNPDYRLPTTACLVHKNLDMNSRCLAFDINLGCSGYVYSLVVAGSMLESGIVNNAVIIMVDQYSKIIDYKDKNTASIFGDAAAATLIEKCPDGFGVIDSNFGTDGSGAFQLIAWNSGVVKNPEKPPYLFMDGKEIFKFTVTAIPPTINELINKHSLSIEDIKFFVFHQANMYMLNEMRKRLKIPTEKMIIDMKYIGNTVSATIPIALKNLMNKNLLKEGDLILLSGFGVGLSWGNILYKWL